MCAGRPNIRLLAVLETRLRLALRRNNGLGVQKYGLRVVLASKLRKPVVLRAPVERLHVGR